jgi:hypothetical protein
MFEAVVQAVDAETRNHDYDEVILATSGDGRQDSLGSGAVKAILTA